jgi:very-short-patch-repair endonuclease
MIEAARLLRRQSTGAEAQLWSALRGKQIDGFIFRRQHPIGRYVADFYCPKACLVIELDGSVHDEAEQRRRDDQRDRELKALDLTVLRFRNHEIETELEQVLKQIRGAIRDSATKALRVPGSHPSSQSEEGSLR